MELPVRRLGSDWKSCETVPGILSGSEPPIISLSSLELELGWVKAKATANRPPSCSQTLQALQLAKPSRTFLSMEALAQRGVRCNHHHHAPLDACKPM